MVVTTLAWLLASATGAAPFETDWCKVVSPAHSAGAPHAGGLGFGTKKLLFYRLRFPGETTDLLSARDADAVMQTVGAVFDRISYGQFELQWTVTPSLVLPRPREEYGSDGHELLAADARALALGAGYDWQESQFDVFQHRRLPGTFYAGIANLGGRGVWIVHEALAVDYPRLVVHELGHNLGLPHANLHYTGNPMFSHPGATVYGMYGTPPFPSNVGAFTNITRFDSASVVGQHDVRTASLNLEYGDPFDIMGSDPIHRGYSAPYRKRLNWLADSNIATATVDGLFRLYAVDAGRLQDRRAYAVRVDRDLTGHSFDGKCRHYWLQHHGALTTNMNLSEGVQLRWEPSEALLKSQYVATSPATVDPFDPATRLLRLGRTFTDPLAQLHFTPVAAGGLGDDRWIEVQIRFGPFPSNLPPTLFLTATTTNAVPGSEITFTATASDPDGHVLHFFWDFGDGTFTNGNAVVTHGYSGASAAAVVRCEASDGQGGVASRHLLVSLGQQPARITGHVRDPAGRPLAHVQVHNGKVDMFSGTQPELVTTDTDSSGSFTLLVAENRPVYPGVFAYGYRVARPAPGLEVTLPAGVSTNVDFILEPLPQLRLSFNPSVAAEGNSNVWLMLTRTGPADEALDVVLHYGGTTDWSDLDGLPMSYQLAMPAGMTELEVPLKVNRDIAVEGLETLVVTAFPPRSMVRGVVTEGVTNWVTFHHPGWELRPLPGDPAWFMTEPQWAVSAEATATLTIEDTTPPDLPRVSVLAGFTQPKEHPPTAGCFSIVREGNTNQALEVECSFSEGQAINGVDFVRVPEIVLMAPGVTNVAVSILPLDDGVPEGPEAVELLLPQPPDFRYGVVQPRARLIIEDSPMAVHRLDFAWRFGGDRVLAIYGNLGQTSFVESSTNLTDWEPFTTILLQWQPTTVFIPPFWSEPMRFYRSRLITDTNSSPTRSPFPPPRPE